MARLIKCEAPRRCQMLRDLAPKELHIAIFSPPVRHPCFYGIDMPDEAELLAASVPVGSENAAIAEYFGADSVTFLSVEGLLSVAGPNSCSACFDGDYIVPVSEREKADIRADRRPA